jgi:hypothetical protein
MKNSISNNAQIMNVHRICWHCSYVHMLTFIHMISYQCLRYCLCISLKHAHIVESVDQILPSFPLRQTPAWVGGWEDYSFSCKKVVILSVKLFVEGILQKNIYGNPQKDRNICKVKSYKNSDTLLCYRLKLRFSTSRYSWIIFPFFIHQFWTNPKKHKN